MQAGVKLSSVVVSLMLSVMCLTAPSVLDASLQVVKIEGSTPKNQITENKEGQSKGTLGEERQKGEGSSVGPVVKKTPSEGPVVQLGNASGKQQATFADAAKNIEQTMGSMITMLSAMMYLMGLVFAARAALMFKRLAEEGVYEEPKSVKVSAPIAKKEIEIEVEPKPVQEASTSIDFPVMSTEEYQQLTGSLSGMRTKEATVHPRVKVSL